MQMNYAQFKIYWRGLPMFSLISKRSLCIIGSNDAPECYIGHSCKESSPLICLSDRQYKEIPVHDPARNLD